jgi:hypothetical protein
MQIKNFEDLEIWKKARYLTREIYTLSKAPQFSKDLIDHLKRSGLRGPKYGGSSQSRPSETP